MWGGYGEGGCRCFCGGFAALRELDETGLGGFLSFVGEAVMDSLGMISMKEV